MKMKLRLPIEVAKKYYMEAETEVRIYATDAGGNYPIHGAYKKRDGSWEQIEWDEQGAVCGYTEIKERSITHEEWVPEDKELVWCWDDDTEFGRILKFYDAVNCATYNANNGRRNASGFDHYAPFEGEYPEWAKKAIKKLED